MIQVLGTIVFVIWSAAFLPVWLSALLMCGNGKASTGFGVMLAWLAVWWVSGCAMAGVQEFNRMLTQAFKESSE